MPSSGLKQATKLTGKVVKLTQHRKFSYSDEHAFMYPEGTIGVIAYRVNERDYNPPRYKIAFLHGTFPCGYSSLEMEEPCFTKDVTDEETASMEKFRRYLIQVVFREMGNLETLTQIGKTQRSSAADKRQIAGI